MSAQGFKSFPCLRVLLPGQNGFLRFTSGVTLADLLAARRVSYPFWSTYLHKYGLNCSARGKSSGRRQWLNRHFLELGWQQSQSVVSSASLGFVLGSSHKGNCKNSTKTITNMPITWKAWHVILLISCARFVSGSNFIQYFTLGSCLMVRNHPQRKQLVSILLNGNNWSQKITQSIRHTVKQISPSISEAKWRLVCVSLIRWQMFLRLRMFITTYIWHSVVFYLRSVHIHG